MDPNYTIVEFQPPLTYTALVTLTDPVVAEQAQRILGLRHPDRRFMLIPTEQADDEDQGGVTPGPPVLTSLSPSSAALGSPSFTLRVLGSGFTPDSVIFWNNSPEPTTFVSASEVTTGVNMETAQVAMDIPVTVQNGGAVARGIEANVLIFTLTGSTGSRKAKP